MAHLKFSTFGRLWQYGTCSTLESLNFETFGGVTYPIDNFLCYSYFYVLKVCNYANI